MSREKLSVVWGRRAVSIPLYVFVALLLALALPVWLPILACVDAVASGQAFPRTRALLFLTLYFVVECAGIAASAWVWATRGKERENAALQRWFTDALFNAAVRLFRMRVAIAGAVPDAGPFVLFVRHASVADTVLAAALLANPKRLLLRYVLKRELLWDPCLDIVGRRLPNAFVARGKGTAGGDVAAVTALAETLDAKSGLLIFPEGTRFSERKRAAALAALAGRPELLELARGFHHVLPPRLGGPLALLKIAGERGIPLVCLDHTGFEGAARFSDFFGGALVGRTIRARFRTLHVPKDADAEWLFRAWQGTDEWVADERVVA